MKSSSPILLRSFLITFFISFFITFHSLYCIDHCKDQSIQIFFLHDSTLEDCMILTICPLLLGLLIC